jgi:hypothetical protein
LNRVHLYRYLPVDIYTSDVKQVESSSPLPLLTRGYLHFGCKAGWIEFTFIVTYPWIFTLRIQSRLNRVHLYRYLPVDIYTSDVKPVESSHLYRYLPVDIYPSDVKQAESSSPLPLLTRGYLHFRCKAGWIEFTFTVTCPWIYTLRM